MIIDINQKTFKKSTERVKKHLRENGIEVKHSTLLESMSIFMGYRNWNTLLSTFDKKDNEDKNYNIEINALYKIHYETTMQTMFFKEDMWVNNTVIIFDAFLSLISYINNTSDKKVSGINPEMDMSFGIVNKICEINEKSIGKEIFCFGEETFILKDDQIPEFVVNKFKKISNWYKSDHSNFLYNLNISNIVSIISR